MTETSHSSKLLPWELQLSVPLKPSPIFTKIDKHPQSSQIDRVQGLSKDKINRTHHQTTDYHHFNPSTIQGLLTDHAKVAIHPE